MPRKVSMCLQLRPDAHAQEHAEVVVDAGDQQRQGPEQRAHYTAEGAWADGVQYQVGKMTDRQPELMAGRRLTLVRTMQSPTIRDTARM